ncbi:MAG: hypothetical protein JJT76_14690 [Clostridiaceae bacterium]|nr:hypothetical protein [Clostridiaceae bacterium]
MKLNVIFIILATSLLLIMGCTTINNDEVQENNNNQDSVEKNEEVEKINKDNGEEFSYLNNLSEEALQTYATFYKDKDIKHLKYFPPEKIKLIYIHSVVIDDIEAIYALTYNNGELPNFSVFKRKYYDNLLKSNLEMALEFRHYDSIEVMENTEENGQVGVAMKASIGNFTASVLSSLKKDSDGWKMDILHLLEL